MAKTVNDISNLIKENGIKMVDFKMVDINGQYRHVTIPAVNFSEDTMKSGINSPIILPIMLIALFAFSARNRTCQPSKCKECRKCNTL